MGKLDRTRYRTARRVVVPICPNLELFDEHARLSALMLKEQAELAAENDSLVGPPLPPSADALAEVQARLETERDYYVIEKVGYQAWLALQMEHPPENFSQQRTFGFNPATFHPAALAASCTCVADNEAEAEAFVSEGDLVPVLDEDDATFLFSELDAAQWSKLWAAVLEVNMGSATPPKSVALALLGLTSNQTSSGTASTTASPPDSSSVESSGGPTTTRG